MAALTDEQQLTEQPLAEPVSTPEPVQDGQPEQQQPKTPWEQHQEWLRSDPEYARNYQSETDRRAGAAAADLARRQAQEALAKAQRADEDRYERIKEHLAEFAAGAREDEPARPDQEWYAQHRVTRQSNQAQMGIYQQLLTEYNAAREKNPAIPDVADYRGRQFGDLLEDVYQAGARSRDTEIEKEARKLADALLAEERAKRRANEPSPETRTVTSSGEGGGYTTVKDVKEALGNNEISTLDARREIARLQRVAAGR